MNGREKISDGTNDRAVDDGLAGTGPGIPDEALAPGADLPEPPSDDEVERIARRLGVPDRVASETAQTTDDEAEAHPS